MQNGSVYPLAKLELGMRETEFGYLLPTPVTTGLDGRSNQRKAIKKRMLPTVTRQDMRHAVSRHLVQKSTDWETKLGEVLVAITGLKKWSPDFAEWMMGWPIGHTELQPSGTDKFHKWQAEHSECFQKTGNTLTKGD
jgi:hypothetical protein